MQAQVQRGLGAPQLGAQFPAHPLCSSHPVSSPREVAWSGGETLIKVGPGAHLVGRRPQGRPGQGRGEVAPRLRS